ncbi:uncharacterized protein JCM15063_000178 [Sporobolomyces koalae]|uniref:uncharacterized protein n=1 Tax=Sporobolomyces koalae TaxID=500713 RepID=UPI003180DB52
MDQTRMAMSRTTCGPMYHGAEVEEQLAAHFASTLLDCNRRLREREPLTNDALEHLRKELLTSRQPTSPAVPAWSQHPADRSAFDDTRARGGSSKPSNSPQEPTRARRRSCPDPVAHYHGTDGLQRLQAMNSLDADSTEEEDPSESSKIIQFPPRRQLLHRRHRSDPGPSSSAITDTHTKRDLRRTLLKRRATLSKHFNQPVLSSELPSRPRVRPSFTETAQSMRLKTFNFPSTSSSPFLLVGQPASSPAGVHSLASSSSSSSSGRSHFSEDSSSESSSSETEWSESDDDEDDEPETRKNAFNLSLDLFPRPPCPPRH